MPCGGAERWYLGCDDAPCGAEQQARASAVHYLRANAPPMLLITGSDDKTVPAKQSIDFDPAATRTASRTALARTFDFFDRTIGHRKPGAQ